MVATAVAEALLHFRVLGSGGEEGETCLKSFGRARCHALEMWGAAGHYGAGVPVSVLVVLVLQIRVLLFATR